MATFYVGPRPVLKGRVSGNMVKPYNNMNGEAFGSGTYSFYPLYSTDHVLDGAPDNDHTPGTGRHPGNVLLSQIFNGTTLYVHPLSGTFPDGKATYDGARFKPLEYKGLAGASAFPSSFGHAEGRDNDYALYSNYIFDGVASADVMTGLGHAYKRTDVTGAASSFGYFVPSEFQGVVSTEIFTDGYGQANVTGDYGREKVKEYKGVPSAKAL